MLSLNNFPFQDNLIGTLLAIFGNVIISIALSIQVQFLSKKKKPQYTEYKSLFLL